MNKIKYAIRKEAQVAYSLLYTVQQSGLPGTVAYALL